MKKKTVSIILIVVLALQNCMSCGLFTRKQDVVQIDHFQNDKVVLKTVSMFGGADPNAEVYSAINNEIMEQYDIYIEDDSQASSEEWKAKVNADFVVGNEPDVIQFFTDATADLIVSTDKLVPISEIRRAYPQYALDTLEQSLQAAANTDGVQRAVPTMGYWEGLYCNKDLFEEYNLELPRDWNSLLTAIRVFRENDIIPIACSLNEVPHYWVEYLMLYSSGIEEFVKVPKIAPEGWAKGLSLFKTLRDLGAFPENTDTIDAAYSGQLFLDKKAAMQLDGSWYAGKITDRQNTVVIPFPGVPDQKVEAGTMIGGISSGFYITRKAWEDPAKRDAAVKFVMAHSCKSAVERYWRATGSYAATAVEIKGEEGDTAYEKSIIEYISHVPTVVAPTDSRIGEAYKVLISEIVRVSLGISSGEDAINEALKVIN